MFSTTLLAMIVAILLDRLLGEPRRFHPLVGFGYYASLLERLIRRGTPGHPVTTRIAGVLAWLLAVAPWTALAAWLTTIPGWGIVADVLLLYFALGAQSLMEHGEAVAKPLVNGDLDEAR